MAWDWEAGPQCGITGTRRQARRHAAAALRSGAASTAAMQQVVVDAGSSALDSRYVPVTGTRLTGRRHGGGVRWELDAGS